MNAVATKKKQKLPEITKEKYNQFVKQLEMLDIRLTSSKIDLLDLTYFPSSADVAWRHSSRYENRDDKVDVFQRFLITISERKTKEPKAKFSVTYCLSYGSKIPLTDDIFEIFSEINVTLHSWPYLREFVASATSQVGWSPFVAPLYRP